MSATFKNAKKKVQQSELRRFMNEHKEKLKKEVKKVDSPLAKYTDNGDLTCILCKSIVRSSAVWPVHINSKQHRENIEKAKKLKESTDNFTKVNKRPPSPVDVIPAKKVKGILKNAPKSINYSQPSQNDTTVTNDSLPEDFFDAKRGHPAANIKLSAKTENKPTKQEPVTEEPTEVLPEGFFDDPKLDAKARNQEYKDPIEEEWERFQKAIKEADTESAAIIAEDQEEATNERQIDEIDEQIKNFSKVLELEKKKGEIVIANEVDGVKDGSDSDVDEVEFDEYLDWRSKRSFK